MNIEQTIEIAAQRLFAVYGNRPDAIYLGSAEAMELDATLSRFGMVRDPAGVGRRAIYRGMLVFVVDAANHIGFGVKPII